MIHLKNLDSVLWADYRGAYGELCELVRNFSSCEDKTGKEEILDELSESLSHQLSFYMGTYLTVPYLIQELLDTECVSWQIKLISEIGIILATDCECAGRNTDALPEVVVAYQAALSELSDYVKTFIVENVDEIKNIQGFDKEKFAVAVFSILGDKDLTFAMINCSFEYCLAMCTSCEEYNEDIEEFSEESCDCIEPATIPDTLSGEYDFSNPYSWFCRFLTMIGMDDKIEIMSYYYGVYVCPSCSARDSVVSVIKNYYING